MTEKLSLTGVGDNPIDTADLFPWLLSYSQVIFSPTYKSLIIMVIFVLPFSSIDILLSHSCLPHSLFPHAGIISQVSIFFFLLYFARMSTNCLSLCLASFSVFSVMLSLMLTPTVLVSFFLLSPLNYIPLPFIIRPPVFLFCTLITYLFFIQIFIHLPTPPPSFSRYMISLFLSLSVCLTVCLSVCLTVCLSVSHVQIPPPPPPPPPLILLSALFLCVCHFSFTSRLLSIFPFVRPTLIVLNFFRCSLTFIYSPVCLSPNLVAHLTFSPHLP